MRCHPMRLMFAVLVLVLAGCFSGGVEPSGGELLSMEVSTQPSPPVTGETVRWLLAVSNDGDEAVSLLFRTTQRGDVSLGFEGTDVYRWAEGRAFTTDVERVVILPGSTETFALEDAELGVGPGDYELLATLNAAPVPGLVRQPISVGAP